MAENRTIVFQRPREFIGYLDKYRISIGLVAPNSMECQECLASSDWIGVYSDDISELFVRRNELDQRHRGLVAEPVRPSGGVASIAGVDQESCAREG